MGNDDAASDRLHRFRFDAGALRQRARLVRPDYRTATPFPHVVLDDFLPAPVADSLVRRFPSADTLQQYHPDGPQPGKSDLGRNALLRGIDDGFRKVLLEFNSLDFLLFLRTLTAIDRLIGDPWFIGGGPHHVAPGGRLEVHRDFNLHPILGMYRRVNVVLYLNPGWERDDGGALELWDAELDECRRSIVPVHNRCVVFTLSDVSWHGHPDPVATVDGRARRSIALYYYTRERPGWVAGARSTDWRRVSGRSGG